MKYQPIFALPSIRMSSASCLPFGCLLLVSSISSAYAPERSQGSGFGHQQVISNAAFGALDVFAADLDGDGDQDVISAHAIDDGSWWYVDGETAWYENLDGLGTFGAPRVIAIPSPRAASVSAADLDGDGDLDVLSSLPEQGLVVWYENVDGLGSFGPPRLVVSSEDAWNEFPVDIDGDGDDDVLYGADDKVAWCENVDGLGTFGPERVIAGQLGQVLSVLATDIDGDGDRDVVSALGSDDIVAWHENLDGLGNFGPLKVISDDADCARSVSSADLDGDGDVDVVCASQGCDWDSEVSWYENLDGLGSFGPQQIITSPYSPYSVVASDLDGDGDQDVVWVSASPDQIAWNENLDGVGGFGPDRVISTQLDLAYCAITSDLDGDGDLDALSASSQDNTIAWYENSPAAAAFRNDTAGANPTGYAASAPLLGEDWVATVDNTGSGNFVAGIMGFADPAEVAVSGTGNFLLVDPLSPGGELLGLPPHYGYGVVTFVVPLPDDPVLAGFAFSTQGGGLGGSAGTRLHNAWDLIVGY